MIYKDSKSLEVVRAVSREADVGLSNRSMTIATSSLSPLLLANATVAAGGGGVVAAGGLAAIAGSVCFAPIVPVIIAITAIIAIGRKKKLKQEKEALLQELVRKQAAVIRQLEQELNASAERIEYLKNLNDLLQKGIRDLKSDLA